MNQLLIKIFSAKNPARNPSPSDPIWKQNPVSRVLFGSTQDREKGWGPRFPQAFFRKSFTCLAKAARILSRPIPLYMDIWRRDGLVGKGLLVAWQVTESFVAWGVL